LRLTIIVIFLFAVSSCKTKATKEESTATGLEVPLTHAQGFSITRFDTHTELSISNPWPNASKTFTYALLSPNQQLREADDFDAIIKVPVTKVVVTSTTHIPALELLNEGASLIGFPGTDYISSPYMRAQIAENRITEIGQNEDLNSEVVLSLNPDLIIGFGIDGVNKSFEILKNGGIPVIYNGDWAENSPLAKAEWLKVFGELYAKQAMADSIFKQIEQNYKEAQALAQQVTNIPTVLSGAMHQDSWYLPYGNSTEGQLLRDANVNYLWQDTTGSGSLALSFESVFVTAQDADIWINPSAFTSYTQLKESNPLYTRFKAYKSKSVYSMGLTKGATGGVLYYELGFTRPDLVLKDLINICHPGLIENYQTTFFKPLRDAED